MVAAASDMHFLPVDYHSEVARELVDFFHSFYRFGAASNVFDLDDPVYTQFLQNILFGSFVLGAVVFGVLCVIVIRRCFLHIRSARVRRSSMESNATEFGAVLLMTFIAVSALSGLLGEAQVDYSVGVVHHAMTNASSQFHDAHTFAVNSVHASDQVRQRADSMIVSFNESDLPAEAFKLSVEALRLMHSAKELVNATSTQLPQTYGDVVQQWQLSYFVLKAATNTAILAVALSSFLLVGSIGWSMVSPLRLSILILLSILPVSHSLIGVYLSSTLLTADFCAAPTNATATLLHPTPAVEFYLACPVNTTSPLTASALSVVDDVQRVELLQQQLVDFAKAHGASGERMQNEFLAPIATELTALGAALGGFNHTQACDMTKRNYEHAVSAFCEYGMLGFVSMWVHQLLLCLFLFVGVVASVLVYERVHVRALRLDVRYQLLTTRDEDDDDDGDVENEGRDGHYGHVYLSAD